MHMIQFFILLRLLHTLRIVPQKLLQAVLIIQKVLQTPICYA